MNSTMTAAARLKAMIDRSPFDRVGVSGWVHLPLVDHNVSDMIRRTVALTDYCGWDFVKLMSTGHYVTEMFGGDITPSADPHSWVGTINRFAITDLEDLKNIRVQDKTNPVIKRETAIAQGVKAHYGNDMPVIATIFNPLTCLQEMMSRGTNDKIIPLLNDYPAEVHAALRKITETNKNYLDCLISQAGIDGIFLANQYMTKDVISDSQFNEFVLPYDSELLDYIKHSTWFNVLHVHGVNNLMFDYAAEYDVQALSWENCAPKVAPETITTVAQVRQMSDKLLITGLARHYDYYSKGNDRSALKELFRKRLLTVIRESEDKRVIFAPGCALPLDVDPYIFTLMQEVVLEEGVLND